MKRGALAICLLTSVLTLPTAIFANERNEWEELLVPEGMPSSLINQRERPTVLPNQQPEQSIENQILRVDQEILILKAEVAYQNGEYNTLKNYLEKLDSLGVLPRFKARVTRLKQLPLTVQNTLPSNPASHLVVSGIQPLGFSGDKEAVVAILLPLTGDYERVGNQLLESLLSGLEKINFLGSLVVLDTALYNSAFDVWQQVKDYEPSFIFGPLRKSIATEWQALNTRIPILYFNEMPFLNGNERAISPSRAQGVAQLIRFLEEQDHQNILVLTEDTPASQKLEAAFYARWHSLPQAGFYQPKVIEKTVGEAIEVATNIKRSKARKRWLQHKIDPYLVFNPRAREDIEVVISFVSENRAIQVSPILDFYRLTDVSHVWFPIQTSSPRFLTENHASWHNTYAALPPYLYLAAQPKIAKTESSEKSGLFHALGQVAVEIVHDSTLSDGLELYVETEFGAITSNSAGQFYLLPMIYSLDPLTTK
ncbi:MAG: penicillin-binding protein activator [Thiomicrorhabdus sp.]|nr:penicillin-binding protein activator [Thiomicrorhabdus sp.]